MPDSLPVRVTGVDFTRSSVIVTFSSGETAMFDTRFLYAGRHEEGNQVFRDDSLKDDREQSLHRLGPYL